MTFGRLDKVVLRAAVGLGRGVVGEVVAVLRLVSPPDEVGMANKPVSVVG